MRSARDNSLSRSTRSRMHQLLRWRARGFLAVPVAMALVACVGPPDSDAVMVLSPEFLPTPVLEGSGEPHLSHGKDGPYLSWLEPSGEGNDYQLRFTRLEDKAWSDARTVTSSDGFFVNWADFPSVEEIDGVLYAHWLQRGAGGGYDYGVRIVHSDDGGGSWLTEWIPHEDGTATEHGFVSIFPVVDGEGSKSGAGLIWLDGRAFAAEPNGEPGSREMALRARLLNDHGPAGPEVVVDGRVCDCCQTDAAIASTGPVVVYRDRSDEEIRDIYVSRFVDGHWTEGEPVHRDGWRINACPVNGPAIDAAGGTVVVAWFTGANEQPRVKVALSTDGGVTFAEPITVDDGNPAGRVDVALAGDGSAWVSWIERMEGDEAEVRVRGVSPTGSLARSGTITAFDRGRASGFPVMLVLSESELLFAWTHVEAGAFGIRTAIVQVEP